MLRPRVEGTSIYLWIVSKCKWSLTFISFTSKFCVITYSSMFFLMSYILFSIFKVNMIGMIDLKEFKGMLLDKQYTNSMNKEEGRTWYSLTQPTFVEILFNFSYILFFFLYIHNNCVLSIGHFTFLLHVAWDYSLAKHDDVELYKLENPNNLNVIKLKQVIADATTKAREVL